jgi:hypothetical protein
METWQVVGGISMGAFVAHQGINIWLARRNGHARVALDNRIKEQKQRIVELVERGKVPVEIRVAEKKAKAAKVN